MVPAKINAKPFDVPAAKWASELHELRQAVEAQPDGASVWLAKIRIDIFEYLLKRYAAGDIDLDRKQPKTLPTRSGPKGLPL